MRVIAGIYRSRTLHAPRGLSTRPTTDRLRETLFNVLAPRIDGCTFADIFAGSGANGIEALSRGAGHVYFVENERVALATIRDNLKTLGIAGGFSVEGLGVDAFLSRLSGSPKEHLDAQSGLARIDIAFLDPPYEDEQAYSRTLTLLGGKCVNVLANDAIVIAEHRHKQPLSESYGTLQRYRVLKQRDAALSFYQVRLAE